MVGYAMAPAPFDPSTFLYCTVGTGLCSAAANAINQVRFSKARMIPSVSYFKKIN